MTRGMWDDDGGLEGGAGGGGGCCDGDGDGDEKVWRWTTAAKSRARSRVEEGVFSEEGRREKKSERAHQALVECIKCNKMIV